MWSERKVAILPAFSENAHMYYSGIGSNNSYNQYIKLSSLRSYYDVLLTFNKCICLSRSVCMCLYKCMDCHDLTPASS